jgi:putative transcriptional regulator
MRHPSARTLYEYAAGRLPPAHATLVEAHLAICQTCAVSVRAAEQAIGERLALLPPADIDLSMAFARFEERVRTETPPPRSPPTRMDWRAVPLRRIAPGMSAATLLENPDGGGLYLMRAAPGAVTPMHRHRGLEMALILEGALDCTAGGHYEPGDVMEAAAETEHEQCAAGAGDCISLLATHGRRRFSSRLARLYQALRGI